MVPRKQHVLGGDTGTTQPMKTLLLAVALVLVSGVAALAQAAIQYGAVYKCHAGGSFRVDNCNGDVCAVFYINPYSPGGGFNNPMSPASVHGMIDGNPAQCSIGGAAQNIQQPQQAAGPAQAPQAKAAQPTPFHYPGLYADMPKYKAPAPGGGITLARYECYTYSGGRLQSAMSENFTLTDGSHYTDAGGASGSYTYSAASGHITFNGGALSGHTATFRPGVQPFKNHPPTVVFPLRDGSDGDTCDGQA